MTRRIIQTDAAPAAIGTYSQAVACSSAKETVYLSGQIPLDPKTMSLVNATIEDEIHQVFRNLKAVCEAAGGSLAGIVKLNKNLKGHAEAIQGMDVLLRIIGEPSAADHAMLKSLGIDYEWKSKLSDEEMQEAYATSDVLLFCSTLEGFGMPILEAKAVGLPVITSDIEPMSEVGKGWAMLCAPDNLQAMTVAIESILSKTPEGQHLHLDAQHQAEEHVRCYGRVVVP